MRFIVTGNKSIYRMDARNRFDALQCAILELTYGFTGNTIIHSVIEER